MIGRALICTTVIGLAGASRSAIAEDKYFDSDGVKIRYTLQGKGEPVLLIHGFSANGDMNWRVNGVIRSLEQNYQVAVIDNRGHGKSDKPETEEAYGQKMADDAIRLLDHLGWKNAYVVGYSMGGMITLNLLAHHPDRVRSAVIGGMGWLPKGDRPTGGGRAADLLERSKSLGACRRMFPDLGITKKELADIKNPMVILIGSEDPLMRRVDAFKTVRTDVPIVVIDGANHINCVMRPEFRDEIKKYIDAQSKKS